MIVACFCEQDGRYEVLSTLAKDFNLETDVDLKLVAEATEGYSPADLKSLLVTAQLSRLDLELCRIQSVSVLGIL
ncbi:Ribosome biogenesis atpase rix7 [Operophtera brumata]|uniref:Ribosome biogenesis atpase rix7 n=1 Tax=Operophtera brumata TaxID=104452 RepID=A0A0L7KWP7_OPEBR|nr:Ribosome biogenesis atpase rix7 [Operophtera brumata]